MGILDEILELVAKAPLTETGKEDIRHTIRTEYAEPLPEGVVIPRKPIRLVNPELVDVDCQCPAAHRHTKRNGCFDCSCLAVPIERPVIVSRVKL